MAFDPTTEEAQRLIRSSIVYGEQCIDIAFGLTQSAEIVRGFTASLRDCPEIVAGIQPTSNGLTALRASMADLASAIDQFQAAHEAAKEVQP